MARPSLFTHRKFTRLARLLGKRYRAVGVLEMVWAHAYQDGDDRLGTVEDLEFMVDWDGEPGECASALVESGFLDLVDGELFVHDLFDHAPDYVMKRSHKETERRKVKRCEQCSGEYHNPDSRSMYCSDACKTAAYRSRQGPSLPTVTEASVTITDSNRCVTDSDRTPAPAPAPAPAPIPNQVDTEDKPRPPRKKFEPPSPKQVAEYAASKDLAIDANRFVDHYMSKGWLVGKSPMKDWQAAVRNWASNNLTPAAKSKADDENAKYMAMYPEKFQ